MGPVIWTEHFPFGSLGSYLERVHTIENPWTARDRVFVICGLVLGLKAIHDEHLFHGSLAPSNIFLDSAFHVFLQDYLSYSFEHYHFTDPVSVPYLAPVYPQFDDDQFVFSVKNGTCVHQLQKVDVFTAGLIIYEILTNEPVFSPHLSISELFRQMSQNERSIPEWIPTDFRRCLKRCLDLDPSNRPTIDDIWNVLQSMNYQIIDGVAGIDISQLSGPREHVELRFVKE
jgi:serine/threonine protein kinase